VKPDPEGASVHRTGRAAVADASGAGHFGPNPATNPNFTHPGHRPPGGADAAFDPVGGDYWLRSLNALTGAGILVGYGFFGNGERA
jgi:NADPH:quinone reductase-like Zn-dependent oxidoreductase